MSEHPHLRPQHEVPPVSAFTRPPVDQVQRIVLKGGAWLTCQHVVLGFPPGAQGLRLLQLLQRQHLWPTPGHRPHSRLQFSLGFSRLGLEDLQVPPQVLGRFALKAPAFWAGAALRAGRHLGAAGPDAPPSWDGAFQHQAVGAVLSVHADTRECLRSVLQDVQQLAARCGVTAVLPLPGQRLPTPAAEVEVPGAQWMHFGYRDGLSRVVIEGWPGNGRAPGDRDGSRHAAGEFLLGHAQNAGPNPWIAGPGRRIWPQAVRDFFANGSFGVLQQLEQDVPAFEGFVTEKARILGLTEGELKAKLCGRTTAGVPLAAPGNRPEDDFDYAADTEGHRCPFGSHVRRMNPRNDRLAHDARQRPLLRRGMPYGPAWEGRDDGQSRGLWGHFFCASIEDQFEHLVGQWADIVPLGSPDRGGARDPLMGAHAPGDGPFRIEREGRDALRLWGFKPFTRNRGTAYLFYPSLHTLAGMADQQLWGAVDDDDDHNPDHGYEHDSKRHR